MKLQVNGESKEVAGSPKILDLLSIFKVESPDMVSVQHNGDFVARADFGSTGVKEGDVIDFLYFMGGGCLI